LRYQQNEALPVPVIVLDAHSNQLTVLLALVPALLEVLANLGHRRFVRIG